MAEYDLVIKGGSVVFPDQGPGERISPFGGKELQPFQKQSQRTQPRG
jgi:hypothetical protein